MELDKQADLHYGYEIKTINSYMRDLGLLDSNYFDIVYQPVSICYVPDVKWVEKKLRKLLNSKKVML